MFNKDIDRCGLVALRLYLCLQVICTFGISPLDSRSYIRAVAEASGVDGLLGLGIMAALGVVALADTIMNDVLNETYEFRQGLRFRHYLLMAMALGYSSVIYMCVRHADAWSILPYLMLNTAALLAATFADIKIRYSPGVDRRTGKDRRKGESHA